MQKITTYSPDQKRSPFAFFILNKGMNSGKPLEQPCPNCFTFNAKSQEEKDHNFWLCFGLWQSKSFHPYLSGSVIPFIHLRDLSQVINQASEKAQASPASFQKTIEALKILDQHEKNYHRNLLLITEAKKAIFANYQTRPSFYRQIPSFSNFQIPKSSNSLPMKKYFNDPRPLTARYTGKCAECGTTLKKGTSAYYWLSDGKIYCLSCGESEYLQFLSAAADEDVYQGIGNPFTC